MARKRAKGCKLTAGMTDLLQFLLKYGYIVTFAAAFLEQIGIPLPAATLLIGMGALSRSGHFVLPVVIATAAFAALAADLIWYELGRAHGRSVLRLLCRVALEPDYCVRRTEDTFERLGMWALLPAKFIPGFNAATVPMAGMIKIPRLRFMAFDIAGVTLWSSTYYYWVMCSARKSHVSFCICHGLERRWPC